MAPVDIGIRGFRLYMWGIGEDTFAVFLLVSSDEVLSVDVADGKEVSCSRDISVDTNCWFIDVV